MKECSYHHWDLDGVVSKIFHDRIYGTKFSKASGYTKIDKNLRELVAKGYESITFTDLAITPEQMQYCVDNFEEVRFFDHHIISEETYEQFKDHPKVKECVFRKDLSGAGIMFVEYMKKFGKGAITPELSKLAKLGDCFDLWQQNDPYWSEAFKLNDLFWMYGFFDFEKRFINGFDGFTDDENQRYQDKLDDIESILDKAPIDETADGVGFIILPEKRDVISHVTFMIPDYIMYYIISYDDKSEQYTLSVRTNQDNFGRLQDDVDIDIDAALSKLVESGEKLTNGGGHKMAAGASFAVGININEIVEYIKSDIHPLMDIRLK